MTAPAAAQPAKPGTARVESISLPASPTNGGFGKDTVNLKPRLTLDVTSEGDVGYATDVAAMPGGQFAVLDRFAPAIVLFDASGHVLRTVGRRGHGPGEMTSPMAFEYVRGGFVVLEPSHHPMLLFVPDAGMKLPGRNADIVGGFRAMRERGPAVSFNANTGEGFDDPTRRLRAQGDNTLVAELQKSPFDSIPSNTARLLRLRVNVSVIDTLPPFATAASFKSGPQRLDSIAARRGLWAVGSDWCALSSASRNGIDVETRARTLRMEWPATGSRPITKAEKTSTGKWLGLYTVAFDKNAAQAFSAMSEKDRQAAYESFAGQLKFAANRPDIAAMIAADRCLLVAGWNPADARDGTARAWTAISVDNGAVLGTFRLAYADSRVRDARNGRVYATHIDSDGASFVTVYALPAACSARN